MFPLDAVSYATPAKGPAEKALFVVIASGDDRREAEHRSAAISKLMPQFKLRSPRLDHEARPRLAMTDGGNFNRQEGRGPDKSATPLT